MKLPFRGSSSSSEPSDNPTEPETGGRHQQGQQKQTPPEYSGNKRVRLTWSLDQVQGFNRSLNPAHLASLKEAIKTEARREANTTDYFKWVIILSIVMIVGALAYYIVQTGSAGSAVSAASSAAGSVGGTSVSVLAAVPRKLRNRR